MHFEEEGWHEDDDTADPISESDQDWNDDYIGNKVISGMAGRGSFPACKRDLEDFAMLQLRVPAWLKEMPDVSYTFEFDKVGSDGPAINLFEAISELSDYLTVDSEAEDQILKTKLNPEPISDSFEYEVSRELIEKGGGIAPFIFEGAAEGTGDLVFSVKIDGVTLVQRRINLQLHDIKWFYDEYKVSGTGSRWEATVAQQAANVNGNYKPSTNEYLLFVHGWNVDDAVKRHWAGTIFKRLWWLGYRGGVGVYSWPALTQIDFILNKAIDNQNFNNSEFIAWQSHKALPAVFQELKNQGKKLTVLAHSQGNVVVGESLRKYTGPTIDTYIATQAALSGNFYDSLITIPPRIPVHPQNLWVAGHSGRLPSV